MTGLPQNLPGCMQTPPYRVSDEERTELDEVLADGNAAKWRMMGKWPSSSELTASPGLDSAPVAGTAHTVCETGVSPAAGLRGLTTRTVRTMVTVHAASAATFADTLPSSVRISELCRAPMRM